MTSPWFGRSLTKLRMSFDRILERTITAQAAGFESVRLTHHFAHCRRAPETVEQFTRDGARALRA